MLKSFPEIRTMNRRQNEKVNINILSEGGNRQKYLNFSTVVETMPQIQEKVTHCYQDK